MDDLINRQAAIEVCLKYNGVGWVWSQILDEIEEIPSAQPEKRTETHPADREDKVNEPKILDATCGMRGIWFQKNEPHTTYCDKRSEHYESDYGTQTAHRVIDVRPDIECDFTDLPFEDNTFNLVVLDPPHLLHKDNSWLKKMYGSYESKEDALNDISAGIKECMRVLKTGGVLIFKWNELDITTKEIINACSIKPLFGHRSGKKSNTHWMCFMKFGEE